MVKEIAGIPVVKFDFMPRDRVALLVLAECPECGEPFEGGEHATMTPTWPGRLIHVECR